MVNAAAASLRLRDVAVITFKWCPPFLCFAEGDDADKRLTPASSSLRS
eukprot:CAMPEP_0171768976 /NCGR_PEP_ID=MMETSP0991-20121206/52701_1 /TAXON_ID=483369 /ORGANISM="non described non described, Strain CCMP2098" /LENGTH=47 /DNA_ID= /DNA_START= /DNA_END= /DNA_ORIENTATION=